MTAIPGLAFSAFKDPLDLPALPVLRPSTRSLLGVVTHGDRLLGVGLRGLIVASNDDGVTWHQIPIGISSDLVFICSRGERLWVTGHDGVILSSSDAGRSWAVSLNGRDMEKLLTQHFEQGVTNARAALESVKLSFASGPEQPVLGVWFDDERTGWAVSTFGILLGTSDGGQSWTSWMERIDNSDFLHLYSITGVGSDVFITSERGAVFKLDRTARRFTRMATGYDGGLFGLVGNDNVLIAYGLRGTALRSQDGGVTWVRQDMGVRASINAGMRLPDGRFAFVTQDGSLLVTTDKGDAPIVKRLAGAGQLTGLVVQKQQLVLVGLAGVRRVELTKVLGLP